MTVDDPEKSVGSMLTMLLLKAERRRRNRCWGARRENGEGIITIYSHDGLVEECEIGRAPREGAELRRD